MYTANNCEVYQFLNGVTKLYSVTNIKEYASTQLRIGLWDALE